MFHKTGATNSEWVKITEDPALIRERRAQEALSVGASFKNQALPGILLAGNHDPGYQGVLSGASGLGSIGILPILQE